LYLASDIIDKVADILQEDFGTAALWDRADLLKYVDSAVREISRRTGAVRKTFSIETASGTSSYPVPPEISVLDFVASRNKEVFSAMTNEIELHSLTWDSDQGAPMAFYQENTGTMRIGLYPKPSKSQTNVQSVQDGYWNDPNVWSVSRVPRLYDVVTVNAAHTVTMNVSGICGYAIGSAAIVVAGILTATVDVNLTLLGFNDITGTFNPTGRINTLNYGSDYNGISGDVFCIGKFVPDAITLETDIIHISDVCEPIITDLVLASAFFQEGDGQDTARAEFFNRRAMMMTDVLGKTFLL
jgi:hypothetical protein